jgi:hypothetical protein
MVRVMVGLMSYWTTICYNMATTLPLYMVMMWVCAELDINFLNH